MQDICCQPEVMRWIKHIHCLIKMCTDVPIQSMYNGADSQNTLSDRPQNNSDRPQNNSDRPQNNKKFINKV